MESKKKISCILLLIFSLIVISSVSAFRYVENDDGSYYWEAADAEIWTDAVSDANIYRLNPGVAPEYPIQGMIYYDSEVDAPKYYNGSEWNLFGGVCDVNETINLISHWDLNENSGSVATDSVGDNDGTIYDATWTEGVDGSALDFDGTWDHVDVNFNNNNFDLDKYTISVWSKVNDWGNYWDGIFSIYKNAQNRIDLELGNDDTVRAYLRTNNQYQFSISSDPIVLGEWNHFVLSVDTQEKTAKFYQNGELKGTANNFNYPSGTLGNFDIGRRDSTGNNLNGLVDELRVYNGILEADDILEIYNSVENPNEEEEGGLLSNWKFDENSGSVATDSIGDNDGTIYDATWTEGVDGSALSFDGVDDYVTATKSDIIAKSGTYTFSAWVKYEGIGGGLGSQVFQNSQSSTDRNGLHIASGIARFGYYNGSSWVAKSGEIIQNEWVHLAGVNNGGSLSFYINAVAQTGDALPYAHVASDYLYIGRNSETAAAGPRYGDHFDGSIDEVLIHNRALSATEILTIYNSVENPNEEDEEEASQAVYWMTGYDTHNVYEYDESWEYTGTNYSLVDLVNANGQVYWGNFACRDITQDSDGNWYVVDNVYDDVWKFTSEWDYTDTHYDLTSQETSPEGIAFGSDGYLYAVGWNSDTVFQYSSDGVYTGTSYDISAQSNYPTGIYQDSEGYWWILDSFVDKVFKYDSSWVYTGTSYTTKFGSPIVKGTNGYGMFQDSEGYWYITDIADDAVNQYDSSWAYAGSSWAQSEDDVMTGIIGEGGQSGGSAWVELDAQTDIEWTSAEEKEFTIATPGDYGLYRITFTDGNHGSRLQMEDVGFWVEAGINIATDSDAFSSTVAPDYGGVGNLVYGHEGYAQWNIDISPLPLEITYTFDAVEEVTSYKIKVTSVGDRAPRDWTLYGQESGANSTDLPITTEFGTVYGTTDFSSESDLTSVEGLVLATQYGKIEFSVDYSINAESEDYDTYVEIGDGFINVDASGLHSSFNSTATLTIGNTTFTVDHFTGFAVSDDGEVYFGEENYNSKEEILAEGKLCNESIDVKCNIIKKGKCEASVACADWGDCINDYQTRTCIIITKDCSESKTIEEQACVAESLFEEETPEETETSEERLTENETKIIEEDEEPVEEEEETQDEQDSNETIVEEPVEPVEVCEEVCTAGEESCEEECSEEESCSESCSMDDEGVESCEETCETSESCEEVCEPGEEVCEEVCEVPEQLFDITFDLEQTTMASIKDLVVWITLQNFGKRYIPARLIYIISDDSGNEIHREFEEVRVYTDKALIKEFGDLELENGKYNFKLNVEYGGIVEEFDVDFRIDDGWLTRIKIWLRDIFK
ncbi:hypothetical protein HNV12_02085 [Methanococcoides sp. SA1]|nr:hypothetical protein [Methanococcoides sp. SA1]